MGRPKELMLQEMHVLTYSDCVLQLD